MRHFLFPYTLLLFFVAKHGMKEDPSTNFPAGSANLIKCGKNGRIAIDGSLRKKLQQPQVINPTALHGTALSKTSTLLCFSKGISSFIKTINCKCMLTITYCDDPVNPLSKYHEPEKAIYKLPEVCTKNTKIRKINYYIVY